VHQQQNLFSTGTQNAKQQENKTHAIEPANSLFNSVGESQIRHICSTGKKGLPKQT